MAPFQLNRISDILKLLNILICDKDSLRINSLLNFNDNRTHSEPPLVIQPNFEITVKPFITLPDSVLLASAMEIKQYDLFSHYTLTRESFLRAFDLGIKSEEILQKLKDLSQKEVPGNVIISLNDWEEDHRKVRLYSGVVLKVSDDKKMLVEKTAFLKPYILENLAPGVYLLDPEQEKQWMEALGELSISPLPASGDTSGEESEAFIPEIKHYDFESMGKRVKWSVQKVKEDRLLESHKESLLRKLNSSGIKGDERKEIEARIKRKLIILESQISRGIIRPEITEAKGMNFQGKVRLIESALLNSSDRLELNHYTQDGVETILVQPIELLKEEKERTLIGKILPDEEMIRIKVSKISKVKKIRSSLF
ncbi:MAG: helicase-associated domain-containing protein [Spirochaetaceae bacterium]|nr:helicase-associated domain-containing protein [Spirochaetaceae bacterium]